MSALRVPTPEQIGCVARPIAERTGVAVEHLRGRSAKPAHVAARREFWSALNAAGFTQEAIAAAFGLTRNQILWGVRAHREGRAAGWASNKPTPQAIMDLAVPAARRLGEPVSAILGTKGDARVIAARWAIWGALCDRGHSQAGIATVWGCYPDTINKAMRKRDAGVKPRLNRPQRLAA